MRELVGTAGNHFGVVGQEERVERPPGLIRRFGHQLAANDPDIGRRLDPNFDGAPPGPNHFDKYIFADLNRFCPFSGED